MKQKVARTILYILGTLLSLLVLYHIYLTYQPEINLLFHFNHHNEQLLVKMVRNHGLEEVIFLFILNTICVAIPGLSNGIFCVLNGILFGPAIGFIINWIGDVLGQTILLYTLQKLYNPKKLKNSKVYQLMRGQNYPQAGLTIGYMIPFIPSATIAYANALINHSYQDRVIPIMLGSIPMAYLYAYGGDSILHFDGRRLITTIITFIIIALVACGLLLIMRQIKQHRKSK